jgi:hypothetical protein
MIQAVQQSHFQEVKRLDRKGDNLPPRRTAAKNKCNYTSIPVQALTACSGEKCYIFTAWWPVINQLTTLSRPEFQPILFQDCTVSLEKHAGLWIMSANLCFRNLVCKSSFWESRSLYVKLHTQQNVRCRNSNSMRQDIKNSTNVCASYELRPTGVWYRVVIQFSHRLAQDRRSMTPFTLAHLQ